MLSSIAGFSRRHKKKLIFTGGVITAGVLAVQYVKRKVIAMQDRLAEEIYSREQYVISPPILYINN